MGDDRFHSAGSKRKPRSRCRAAAPQNCSWSQPAGSTISKRANGHELHILAKRSLWQETAYETYCAAKDTATNPSCTDPGCPAVPNLNTSQA